MKVENTLDVYEVDDVEVKLGETKPTIIVKSHWNRDALVVLEVDDEKYTVSARELTAAIENATNTKRHG